MMTIIRCFNCDGEKSLPFTFQQTIHEDPCKKCGETKRWDKTWHFCSLDCSLKVIRKIKNHKCEQCYVSSSGGSSIDKKNKIITVWEHCSVCLDSRWRKIKGKELKKYLNHKNNKLVKIMWDEKEGKSNVYR